VRLCATGSASAESLFPRRVTSTGKASGTRNGQVISTVLSDPDRRCPRDQYAGRFLQEETEETEMTEVNKLVAFSPPLRFLCLLLFPCFPAPLTESPARRLSVSVRSLVISIKFLRTRKEINYRIEIERQGASPPVLRHRTACAVPLIRQFIVLHRLSRHMLRRCESCLRDVEGLLKTVVKCLGEVPRRRKVSEITRQVLGGDLRSVHFGRPACPIGSATGWHGDRPVSPSAAVRSQLPG